VFQWRARDKGLELSVRCEPGVPEMLIGDPGRLRQILVNLVGNAIKFTDRGEVTAAVASAREEGGDGTLCLHFAVRDTGIGIPLEKQETIFRAFEQADGSTTRKYGGTGLGLAITQRLVEMMGGRLWVESRPGAGSTFHFTAVFGQPPAGTRPALDSAFKESVAPPAVLRPLDVLLVEDGVVNQKLAIRLLEKKGHRVTLACNGKEALDMLEQRRFDLVLMDLQIPEMGGLEATAILREREKETGRRVPVVAMTAHALRGDEERCLQAGMDGYVSKPIQPARLWEVMSAVLDQTSPCAAPAGPPGKSVADDEALLARCGGDVEMKREVIQLFLEEYPALLTAIRDAVAAREAETLGEAAHQLKGSSSNFGAERVVAAALRLEQMGTARCFDEADLAFRELEEALAELHEALASSATVEAAC
jgi:CheY-like chemotaxis protein